MIGYRELGVDLGSDSIKITLGEKIKGTRKEINRVKKYKIYKVTSKKYSKEYFSFLRRCLREFSAENSIKRISLNIVLSVDLENVFVGFITTPYLNKKTFSSSIKFEIEQKLAEVGNKNYYSSFDNKNYYSSWEIVNDVDSEDNARVMIGTVSHYIIDSLSQFKTINTRVNKVMLQPLLLEEAVENTEAILDLSHKSTRINFYTKGKLSQVEVLNFGGLDVLNIIEKFISDKNLSCSAESLLKDLSVYNETLDYISNQESSSQEWDDFSTQNDLDEDLYGDFEDGLYSRINDEDFSQSEESLEDEDVLKLEDILEISAESNKIRSEEENYNVKEENQPSREEVLRELSVEVNPYLNSMINDVKRIVRMFELENNKTLSSIKCIGEFSELRLLKEKLNSEIDLLVETLDLIDIESPKENDDKRLKSILTLSTLASVSAAKKKDGFNFNREIKANIDYTAILIMVLATSLSSGIGATIAGKEYSERLSEAEKTKTQQMNTISIIDNELDSINEEKYRYEKFTDVISRLGDEKKWLSDGLYLIPDLTPLTISIQNMETSSNEIIIHGYSSDYTSIGGFARKLESLGEVNISSITSIPSSEGENIYTVTMDNPDLISDKYKASRYFKITISYNGPLLSE